MYLGNLQQADVLVRAVPMLRRGSGDERRGSVLSTASEVGAEWGLKELESDEDHVYCRARVYSIVEKKKPFLISRRLNRAELRLMAEKALREDREREERGRSPGIRTPVKTNAMDEDGDKEMVDAEEDTPTPESKRTSTPKVQSRSASVSSPASPERKRLPPYDARKSFIPLRKYHYLPCVVGYV